MSDLFPNPSFEGSEKRIEIHFLTKYESGLRQLSRQSINAILEDAVCTVVSCTRNDYLDAYVLSESSLFVYADRFILKTCGTTRLLKCIPRLLQYCEELCCEPVRVKFSRASYLFPQDQLDPHSSFDDECSALRTYFDPYSLLYDSVILGDPQVGLKWHTFVAEATGLSPTQVPTSVELCCTQLSPTKTTPFFRSQVYDCAQVVTASTGIADILPGATIDGYLFEPCGYSMNGLLDDMYITIHITPEDGQSYASVEVYSPSKDIKDKVALLARAQSVFQADKATVCVQHPRWKMQDSWVAAPPETAGSFEAKVGTCFGLTSVTQLKQRYAESSDDMESEVVSLT